MSKLEISGSYTYIDNNNKIDVKYINIKEITNKNNKNLDMSKIKNIYVENKINKNDNDYINFDMKKYIYNLIDKNLENDINNDDIYSDKNLYNSIDDDYTNDNSNENLNYNLIEDEIYSDENIEYILYNNNKLYIKDKEEKIFYEYQKKIIIFGIIILFNYLRKSPKVLSLA